MKGYILPLVIGGIVITLILQGVQFASTGTQFAELQKQLTEITKKIDSLQAVQDSVQLSLSNLRNPTTATNNPVLGLSDTDLGGLLSPENLALTLNPSPAVSENKSVRLKTGWNVVDVFETTKTSSRILGQVIVGKDYPIISKQQGWYQIKFDTLTNAYVQSQFVNETN